MKIQFHGAVRTVTGSMHVLETDSSRLLLDCGLYQGKRREAFERNRHFPFDPRDLTACVLSHAHIDHSGNIPNLVQDGFTGNIHTTFATRDLCSVMLLDSGNIQESDAEYIAKVRRRHGESDADVEPLYTVEDARASLQQFVGWGYDRPFDVAPGVRAILRDAGHILGSASITLDATENGRTVRIAYSGDLGRPGMPILRDPVPVHDVDYLLIESTYGDRVHPPVRQAEDVLEAIVNDTARRGGKVVIPSFAVGRAQEIIYTLHRMIDAGRIQPIPFYVDSPLAIDVTEVFRLHPECYDQDITAFMRSDRHPGPFGFGRLEYVRSVEESKALNDRPGPMIIMAASGMAEAGRIRHHLANTLGDPRNTILFVGYQAENTLGRKLVEGEPTVQLFDEKFKVRARVEKIDGLSAHADRHDLLEFVGNARSPRLKGVFVLHGDIGPAEALADAIRGIGISNVLVPEPGQAVAL